MCPETEAIYSREFRDVFDYFANSNLRVSTETDMSAVWKGLKRGGAAKVHNQPCHCCGIFSVDLAKPNAKPCMKWCNGNACSNGNECYHKDIVDDQVLQAYQEDLNTALSKLLVDDINLIFERTKIPKNEDPSIVPENNVNPLSIHFIPKEHVDKASYSRYLNVELKLRNLPTSGNMSTRRERLKSSLIIESDVRKLTSELSHCTPKETACFLMINAIPCILHMELRVGLKILTMLLVEGLSNVKERNLYVEIDSLGGRISRFLQDVSEVVNKELLGTNENPTQWEVPYDPVKQVIGIICLENGKTRRIIEGIEKIIRICVPTAEIDNRRNQWNHALLNYNSGMEIVRQKSDYTDFVIFSYQKYMDNFHNSWIELHGLAGQTNYTHMIGSGHIGEYMLKWRNLYRHSQQGWESLNWLIKTVYFRRTNRGGATGNNGRGKRTRLKPIGRWLQRRMMWATGLTGDNIEDLLESCTTITNEESIDEQVEEEEQSLNIMHH